MSPVTESFLCVCRSVLFRQLFCPILSAIVFVAMRQDKELASLTKMREFCLSPVNALNGHYAHCIHELISPSGLILD